MSWITRFLSGGAFGKVLGIGKGYVEAKQHQKLVKIESETKIIEAETDARVNRTMSNTNADNLMDELAARDKKNTFKDDYLIYLGSLPLLIASLSPFIVCYYTNSWEKLLPNFIEAWKSLSSMPEWYPWILAAVYVDVLGFRSFARQFLKSFSNRFSFSKQKGASK